MVEIELLFPELDKTNHAVVEDEQWVELWLITAAASANELGPILNSQHGTTQNMMQD